VRSPIFLYELLADLGVEVLFPLVIWSDSKSAIAMSYDPVSFKKTKHILRAAEFLRDLVAREVIRLDHISGTVMVADLLTKAVHARALREARCVFLLWKAHLPLLLQVLERQFHSCCAPAREELEGGGSRTAVPEVQHREDPARGPPYNSSNFPPG
jgi:hypothetical protein